ncbi:MAG: EAL domain-containing protein [Gammaproteobacteria bacterium]|nr:EAL domain-containing protein [Gammaproteobacteria bacterium]
MTNQLPSIDQLLYSIPDAVVITDAHGRVQYLNPAASALTGWSAEAAVGQPAAAVVTSLRAPQPCGNDPAPLAAVCAGTQPSEHEDILLTDRNGRQRRIKESIHPILSPDGGITGTGIVFRDITAVHRLREERRIAAMAFEIGAPLLVATAADLRVLRVNAACLELSQRREQELVGVSLDVLYGDAEKAPFLKFFRSPEPPDTIIGRTTRRNRAGILLHLSETARKIRDESGAVSHFVVGLYDLTEAIATAEALRESQLNYNHLIESMQEGVAIIQDNHIIGCNGHFAHMLGRPRDAIIGKTAADVSGPSQPDGRASAEKSVEVTTAALRDRHAWVDWQVTRPDGSVCQFEASITPSTLEGAAILLVTTRDITERKRAEAEYQDLMAELAAREKMIRLANRAYGIACWELNPATLRMSWSEGAEDLFGAPPGVFAGGYDGLRDTIHPDDWPLVEHCVTDAVTRGQGFDLDVRMFDKEGRVRWTHTQAEVERDADGQLLTVRGAVADITEQKAAQETIEQLAYFDPLTQLPNRRLLFDRVRQAVAAAKRSGGCGALLFIDLDHFKRINDSLGHRAGDQLLMEVARRLRALVREEDTVARLGGDEFVVVLHEVANTREVRRSAHRVLERLSGEYSVADHRYHLSVSMGVALFPSDGEDPVELLHRADAAMYQAKKDGRSTISFFQAALQSAADERFRIELGLRTALASDEFELYYQPKVMDGNRVVGAETLLRWHHPERGFMAPGDFISVAEETGLIVDIGTWILDAACRQLARWNRDRAPAEHLMLAVNVSPIQFRNPEFVARVKKAITDYQIVPSLLTLEITEGILIEKVEETVTRLAELKALGVRLSIDDFGTGFSSLNYLKRLPLDEIKIDRSFVTSLVEDANNTAIVKTMVAIATTFNLNLVAEGVETLAEAEFLRALGCHCHQGYLYARPLTEQEFTRRYCSATC